MDFTEDPKRVKAFKRAWDCFEKRSRDDYEGIPLEQCLRHLVFAQRRRMLLSPEGDEHLRGAMDAALNLAKHLEALDAIAELLPPIPAWLSPSTLRTFEKNQRSQYTGPPQVPKGVGTMPNVVSRFLAFECAELLEAFGIKRTSGKNGSTAKLASAIHTAATGQEISFEWDAGLVRDPKRAATELFKVAPPRLMTPEVSEEVNNRHPKRFRKPS